MPSQFTIYKSTDVSAPVLTGQAGSLITLLDACLINGYGSQLPPSPAWTKPVATSSNITSYKQGAGAGLSFVLNDNGPNATSTYKEAWATGWESVSTVGAPVGTGAGQFPTPAQLLTTGHVVCRKSATADATARSWIVAADSSTVYVWISVGDIANEYTNFRFGDIFSLKGATDAYRVAIVGRAAENAALSATTTQESSDFISTTYSTIGSGMGAAFPGMFMARTYGGGGTSILIAQKGDQAACGGFGNAANVMPCNGGMQNPNGPDNSVYLCPLGVTEAAALCVRGRWRGLYQICNTVGGFVDGQTFSGGGDFAGKSFLVIKQGPNSTASTNGIGITLWALETSATIETN